MNDTGKRIQELRKKKGLNQTQLAERAGVSLTQLQRYENKGVQPHADALRRMADEFNVSIDYIIYGDTAEKAVQAIRDNELLAQFKAVEELDEKDRNTIKDIIDAFIKRNKIRSIAAL
ncbi:helix-turn-helix domain-containing protein [Bacteroidales bacterium OttesenSCG-928-B11]|nr:helix-turn-helix domain-containing protein [Bacteroidales bacterium OttesenSCG-928-E04]MDL2313327.1 helix-turn-helix domain-containing protein [Bacteroidales bacterium OttesenSCG-928-B11]MDL2326928.1 helix-turn-helix domain-containing protein [Bacteroidales bacterium OttesenSCG-928-A14]